MTMQNFGDTFAVLSLENSVNITDIHMSGAVVKKPHSIKHGRNTVNTIPPDTEIHEQITMRNGYGKVFTTTSTLPTSVRPLWTIT